MNSRDFRELSITVLFLLLGVSLWYGSGQFTDHEWIQWAVLLGVAVIVPTVLTAKSDL